VVEIRARCTARPPYTGRMTITEPPSAEIPTASDAQATLSRAATRGARSRPVAVAAKMRAPYSLAAAPIVAAKPSGL
jgi:hypothetical protein